MASTKTDRAIKAISPPTKRKGLEIEDKEGKTIISTEVIADIAGVAIREVAGVHSLVPFGAGQSFSAFANRIAGKETRDVGVHVEVGEVEAAVDCRIVVHYGVRIPQIAQEIRASLRSRIEEMTGLITKEVNIEVVDLYFEEPEVPALPPGPPEPSRVR